MHPRLLLDENVTWELAAALRRRGHDVVHVRDLGLLGAQDPIVFDAAIRDGRVVVTYDVDFLPLARQITERGDHHFGVVLTRHPSFRPLFAAALHFLESRTAADLRDAVVWM